MGTLTLGIITEDPETIGVWQQFRDLPPNQVLNPGGDTRGDGRPDIAYKVSGEPGPTGSWPVVVWAYKAGADHDVAIAEWTGTAWSAIVFLTAGIEDDLDPRAFVEADGTAHVVWWTDDELDRVVLATRSAATGLWSAPIEVIAGGRRPSVAVLDGVLRVAFERDSVVAGMQQEVVVLRREPAGSFGEESVATTARSEPLDAMLHVSGGTLWLDWMHGEGVFGSVEYGPSGWGAVAEPPWSAPTWVGVEETRRAIEIQVLLD